MLFMKLQKMYFQFVNTRDHWTPSHHVYIKTLFIIKQLECHIGWVSSLLQYTETEKQQHYLKNLSA